jgi:hypothetical protein
MIVGSVLKSAKRKKKGYIVQTNCQSAMHQQGNHMTNARQKTNISKFGLTGLTLP